MKRTEKKKDTNLKESITRDNGRCGGPVTLEANCLRPHKGIHTVIANSLMYYLLSIVFPYLNENL